eukprot:TRINITY_DN6114_c0_g2_i1.p1 TRINITY_DN6114_c0_g2~~TRINITY_DN6114_c0_g2_i1.p1  ORF type:complete len:103 (-),score=18.69 TRINITY_DN6114_c0_g2_i1:310-618(-)
MQATIPSTTSTITTMMMMTKVFSPPSTARSRDPSHCASLSSHLQSYGHTPDIASLHVVSVLKFEQDAEHDDFAHFPLDHPHTTQLSLLSFSHASWFLLGGGK